MKRSIIVSTLALLALAALASCASQPAPAAAAKPAPAAPAAAAAPAAPAMVAPTKAADGWVYFPATAFDFFVENGPGDFARWKVNGDGTLGLDTSADGALKAGIIARPAFSPTTTAATFVGRFKAGEAPRGFDVVFCFGNLETRTAGPRVKLVVAPGKLQIEKPDGQNSASSVNAGNDATQYHIYQLTFKIANGMAVVDVYIDGNDTPVMSANVTATSSDSSVFFGDMGSNPCVGTLDWAAWTDAGAFKPSELRGKLPKTLGDTGTY